LIADAESRSMSAQALHLIKSGMQMYLQQKTRQSASRAP